MKPNELWHHLRGVDYHTTGKKLDWFVEVDDTEKKIRVMFEESHQPIDWFFNFFFLLIPAIIGGTPYWFSIGWWTSWCSGKELVMHNIMTEWEKHPDYEIEICGYSFGGAIAQLCAIEVYERMGIKSNLITFGSPKPLFGLWTKLMARRCVKSFIQYANWSDIVTWCVPLPMYHCFKNTRLGTFSLKQLFNPVESHQIYGKEEFYR